MAPESKDPLITSDYSSGASEASSEKGSEFQQEIDASSSILSAHWVNNQTLESKNKNGSDLFSNASSKQKQIIWCSFCPFANKSRTKFIRHMKCHNFARQTSSKKPYICLFCNHVSFTFPNFKKHERVHFNFDGYLTTKGIRIKYQRTWEKTDEIEMEIVSNRFGMQINSSNSSSNKMRLKLITDE